MKTSARPTWVAVHESGAFGGCETCHRAVPLARLRALPATRYCGPCQARLESGR